MSNLITALEGAAVNAAAGAANAAGGAGEGAGGASNAAAAAASASTVPAPVPVPNTVEQASTDPVLTEQVSQARTFRVRASPTNPHP